MKSLVCALLLALPALADPIHDAARGGSVEKVRKFIEDKGVRVDRREPSTGWSALHVAAQSGHLDLIRYLVSKKANINIVDNRNATPVMDAIDSRQLEATKLLLELGAKLNFKDPFQCRLDTLVSYDSENGDNIRLLQFMIEHGANPKETTTGSDLLQEAAQNGALKSAEFALSQKLDVNSHNFDNRYPIDLAAQYDHPAMVSWLLDHGAKIEVTTSSGWTPLHVAAFHGNTEVIKVLLARGADRNAKDKGGKTAADLARDRGKSEVLQLLAP